MAAKAARKKRDKAGYDGAVIVDRPVRTGSSNRIETQSVRCQPGTFEWRYGAKGDSGDDKALYLAGAQFARVWERAGIASAGQSGVSDSIGGDWKGVPDARCVALDEVREVTKGVGKLASARLRSYCVEGQRTGDIAEAWNIPHRDMAAVLAMDLRALAVHYRFLQGGRY